MVKIFGTVSKSVEQAGSQTITFNIPAISKSLAKQRAKANARLKGMNNFIIDDANNVADGDLPAQSIYEVTIVSRS